VPKPSSSARCRVGAKDKAGNVEEPHVINIKKSNLQELEENLSKAKIPEKVFIKQPIFEDLKKLFGKDVEVLISY